MKNILRNSALAALSLAFSLSAFAGRGDNKVFRADQRPDKVETSVREDANDAVRDTAVEKHGGVSDRAPARVEGDLSPEANELLHNAGQKVERMLDRSTRGN